MGSEHRSKTRADLGGQIVRELKQWAAVVRDAGIKVE